MHFLLDNLPWVWDNKDNEERLLERDMPVRSCGTASLSEDFWMTDVLYAKGYDKTDGETPIYFWGLGSYKYEIERRPIGHSRIVNSYVFEASYEEAMNKFEDMIDLKTGVLM